MANRPDKKLKMILEEQVRLGAAGADVYCQPAELENNNIEYFKRAIEVDPYCAKAYMEIARNNITNYPKPYDDEKALADISKAIALDPQLWQAYELRAILYHYTLNEPQKALDDLETVLKNNTDNEFAAEFKADILKDMEEEKEYPHMPEADSYLLNTNYAQSKPYSGRNRFRNLKIKIFLILAGIIFLAVYIFSSLP